MSDFGEFVRRRSEEKDASQREAEERAQRELTAHQERLGRILHAAPILTTALLELEVPKDVELVNTSVRLTKRGFRGKKVTPVYNEEPMYDGWTLWQHIGTSWSIKEVDSHFPRGVMLTDEGEVIGYNGGTVPSRYDYVPKVSAVRTDLLTPGYVNDFEDDGRPTIVLDEPRGRGIRFDLADVEEGLANLAVKHQVDPALFS